MKQLTLNQKKYLFVEVPEVSDYFSIEYHENHLDKYLHFISDYYRGLPNYDSIDLPPGNWSDPIKASEVTEEFSKMLVREYGVGNFPNYTKQHPVFLDTATESLTSLIRSIGMETEKTVILTEK